MSYSSSAYTVPAKVAETLAKNFAPQEFAQKTLEGKFFGFQDFSNIFGFDYPEDVKIPLSEEDVHFLKGRGEILFFLDPRLKIEHLRHHLKGYGTDVHAFNVARNVLNYNPNAGRWCLASIVPERHSFGKTRKEHEISAKNKSAMLPTVFEGIAVSALYFLKTNEKIFKNEMVRCSNQFTYKKEGEQKKCTAGVAVGGFDNLSLKVQPMYGSCSRFVGASHVTYL